MTTVAAGDQALLHFLPGETEAAVRLRERIARMNERVKQHPQLGRAVLLVGESGVGKNYVARVIAAHAFLLDSPLEWPTRGDRPLPSITQLVMGRLKEVNLPSVPKQLVASTLFGHKKGAFTDAKEDRDGALGLDCSHVLLDEIGDIDLEVQVQLLQVLQDGMYFPLGAQHEDPKLVESRILFATNRRLEGLVRSGHFREDLYWRMQQLVIEVPPLRARKEQISELARNLVTRIRSAHGIKEATQLSGSDLEWATKQHWRGNVRELERLLWRWVFEGGKESLADIQKGYPELDLALEQDATIHAAVRLRFESALKENSKLAASAGDFLRALTRETQEAIVKAREDLGLDPSRLGKLFDDGPKAAKLMSSWKNPAQRESVDPVDGEEP